MCAICNCDLRLWFAIAIFCIHATKNRMLLRLSMDHWATALDLVRLLILWFCLYVHIWYQNFQNLMQNSIFVIWKMQIYLESIRTLLNKGYLYSTISQSKCCALWQIVHWLVYTHASYLYILLPLASTN